jgi:hypothetical protein
MKQIALFSPYSAGTAGSFAVKFNAKASAVLCFLILLVCTARAQFANDYSLPAISQPSPNAVSLGQYGDVPVSYYTGIPQICIPLFSIKTQSGFELPVSLSYYANGVKIDDLPSSVGMNWSLNAGGAITKTTRGMDDFGLTSIVSEGYYWTQERAPMSNTAMGPCIFAAKAADGDIDIEPDLFYYNVTGAAGKFIFKTDKSILQLPYKNMDIEVQGLYYPVNSSTKPTWIIKDADGNIYNFGETGIEKSQIMSVSPSLAYTSSCFLTEIITKAPSESVTFEYENYIHEYTATAGGMHGVGFALAASPEGQGDNGCESTMFSQSTSSNMKSYSKLLSRITYRGYTIEFFYSVSGIASQVKKLDEIVYKYNGVIYRKFVLQYLIDATKDRFWLTKIIDVDVSTNGSNNNYTISYQSPSAIPARLSGIHDRFGYYNQNANPHFAPKIPGILYGTMTYPSVNTDPDIVYMLYGTIDEIIYPTKGKTKFIFEPHYFKASDTDPSTYTGAGVRVKEVISYDDASTTAPFKREIYSYEGGKIMIMPNPYYYYVTGCTYSTICRFFASITTSNVSLSNSAMGSMVGYSKVTRMMMGPLSTPNGKDEFEYLNNRPALPYVSNGGSASQVPYDALRLIPPGTPCTETNQSSQNGFLLAHNVYAYKSGSFLPVQKISYTIDPNAPADGQGCSVFRYPACALEPSFSDPDFCNRIVQVDYSVNAKVSRPISKEIKIYDLINGVPTSNFITATETYEYDKLQVSKQTTGKSNTQAIVIDKTYRFNAKPFFTYNAPVTVQKRIGGVLTDDAEYLYHSSEPTLVEEIKFKENQPLGTSSGNTALLNDQSNVVYAFNSSNELTDAIPYNGIGIGYLWDKDLGKLMAEARNGKSEDIAFTSFESAGASGRFNYSQSGITNDARTGCKGYELGSSNMLSTNVTTAGNYKITFWIYTGFSGPGISLSNGNIISQFSETYTGSNWTFRSFTIKANRGCTINITGNGTIDEVKLHPEEALMKSYVHHPFYGMLSENSEKANIKTYQYDVFGRLFMIRDHDETVLQLLKYNLK